MSVVFTSAGKAGDALHQWPIAYHWSKQHNEKFDMWMDEKTCAPLVPLFQAQPCVNEVKLVGGVENHNCGGQPFHLNLPTSAFQGNTIYHLGLRGFPSRQLTLQCLQDSKVPVDVDVETLTNDPSIVIPTDAVDITIEPLITPGTSANLDTSNLYVRPGKTFTVDGPSRLVVHGQGICPHNRSTPTMWKFLSGIKKELDTLFDEIVFVGSKDDLETALIAYPDAKTFDDEGDFLKLAGFIAGSRGMIGVGSAPIVLAGLLKVPSIRVHDPIGNDAPKVIWNNLASNSINETEIELRKAWPVFRDKWLVKGEVQV